MVEIWDDRLSLVEVSFFWVCIFEIGVLSDVCFGSKVVVELIMVFLVFVLVVDLFFILLVLFLFSVVICLILGWCLIRSGRNEFSNINDVFREVFEIIVSNVLKR